MTKNTIESLNFAELYQCVDDQAREQWCKDQNLLSKQNWMWPQILAHYGSWRVVRQVNALDLLGTLKHNIQQPWHLGLWTLVTKVPRSLLIRTQTNPDSVNWSNLVPVILAALKRDQNIPYNHWPRQDLHRVMPKLLWECVQWADTMEGQACHNLGSEELIQIRTEALVTKTGKTAGKPKNPLSTWTLTGLQGTPLWGTPKLISTMLCQVWVAHPQLRTGYMILDPWDLDRIPPSLWGENLFSHNEIAETNTAPNNKELKLPWE